MLVVEEQVVAVVVVEVNAEVVPDDVLDVVDDVVLVVEELADEVVVIAVVVVDVIVLVVEELAEEVAVVDVVVVEVVLGDALAVVDPVVFAGRAGGRSPRRRSRCRSCA